jgi:pimeloyl-ACP methyl ester carboxylesterase
VARSIGSTTLLTVLLLSSCSGQADEGRFEASPSPTQVAGRVDVGGYELAYECRGHGSPTIITEAGYDSAGTSAWFDLMDDLASISRVCSYDRAGTGTSDVRPAAHALTSADQAAELQALLEQAGIDGPLVLVAHSYGGFVSRLFADAYPDETAGLVLVESSHEDEIDAYKEHYGEGDPRADWIDGGDLLDIDATEAALRRARHYGAMPLVAIRSEKYEDVLDEDLWIETQADLATLSTNALHVVALGSGHDVMEDNPAVVLAAVEAVVDAARSGRALPPCSGFVMDLEGGCP